MNWKTSRSLGPFSDVLTVALAAIGVFVAWKGIPAGGAWSVIGWLFLLGVALIAWGVFAEPRRLAVRKYRVALAAHPEAWVRIVFMSDMHAGGFRKRSWYGRVALEANSLGADLAIWGGDMVAERAEPVADLKPLASVTAHLGRYFVLGNHDYLDDPTLVRRTVAEWGITDLTNSSIALRKDGRAFEITVIDDCWHGRPIVPPFRSSKDVPHVTIAHEPDAALDFREGDTDLILSGHTHGGQIRLPFIGSIIKIPSILGRKADEGRKVVNGVPVIVSEGLAETDLRSRLFCPPELMVVDIGI